MGGDDVAERRRISGVRRDGRERHGAVGVVQGVRGIGDVEDRVYRAACVAGRWFPDDEDVGAVVVDVRSNADEVIVVPELGIVVEQVAVRYAEPAPAVRQIAGVGRLGPAKDQHVGPGGHSERRIQPAASLLVPLDLWIAYG